MTEPRSLDPSASPRALLGAELRHRREASGHSQGSLGQLLFVSGSFIGQLEAGTRRLLPDIAERLDDALTTGGFFVRNVRASSKSKHPKHFAEAAEAEAVATEIREYDPLLIPGLLQSERYAHAVFRAHRPTVGREEIDELVAVRTERAKLLDDPTGPLLWVVLDEAALRRPVGGPTVMAEALRHVADLAGRPRIVVQVVPFAAQGHSCMAGAVRLMSFADSPTLAYLQGFGIGILEDDPATVAGQQLAYQLLGASALSPRESLALINAVAEDYSHEANQQP
ncbi:XRE family transcriptional regulator [Streptomyces triticagri]|uniref:XRE family transcriptional regulator n=1 Tax=Streptomyces triticagri TaxID=2293568 RepID=A0A372M4N1_9ACTN|nr:helix-turn-helix transcriptional regulator [Streptomyces triticagri]RFU85580.1 XRE family transcriptional regulator [Streptomyces triticagri]